MPRPFPAGQSAMMSFQKGISTAAHCNQETELTAVFQLTEYQFHSDQTIQSHLRAKIFYVKSES
jgi:hypothetical protein